MCVKLEALRRADDEDGARVLVEVEAGGFRGDFEAWLQSDDLAHFSKQLGTLYEHVGQTVTGRPRRTPKAPLGFDARHFINGPLN